MNNGNRFEDTPEQNDDESRQLNDQPIFDSVQSDYDQEAYEEENGEEPCCFCDELAGNCEHFVGANDDLHNDFSCDHLETYRETIESLVRAIVATKGREHLPASFIEELDRQLEINFDFSEPENSIDPFEYTDTTHFARSYFDCCPDVVCQTYETEEMTGAWKYTNYWTEDVHTVFRQMIEDLKKSAETE